MERDLIIIVDVGSTENERLMAEISALGVDCRICAHNITAAALDELGRVKGIILNGGALAAGRDVLPEIYNYPVPVLQAAHNGDDAWPEDAQKRGEALELFVCNLCGMRGGREG